MIHHQQYDGEGGKNKPPEWIQRGSDIKNINLHDSLNMGCFSIFPFLYTAYAGI